MGHTDQSVAMMIEHARRGERSVLVELLFRYRPLLCLVADRAIAKKYRSRFDQSDAVQLALFEAHRDFASFRGNTEAEFSSWLHRILRNNLHNLFREHNAEQRAITRERAPLSSESETSFCIKGVDQMSSEPSVKMVQGEAALELAAAIDRLTPDQRTAVRMRYLDGATLPEIACELGGRSLSATAGLIKRGTANLRQFLRQPAT